MAIYNKYDRIDRVEGVNDAYKNFCVDVFIDDSEADLYTVQVMVIVATNLLVNWCKSVNIHVQNTPCKIPKYRNHTLHDVLKIIFSKVSDKSFFINESSGQSDINLFIGNCKNKNDDNMVWADCSGWISGFGRGERKNLVNKINADNNFLSASFAASLAVAEIFRVATKNSPGNIERWYSLFDLNISEDPDQLNNKIDIPVNLDIGIVNQFGCGAVGSSLVYLLGCSDWNGQLNGIDFDTVQEQNCPSSLLFSDEDVNEKRYKVDVCSDFLINTKIDFHPHIKDSKEFYKSDNLNRVLPDVTFCLANERNVWLDIQYSFPSLVYHATTTKNWGVNFGRHIPLLDWCLVCRFDSEMQNKMKPICSDGVIGNTNSGDEIHGMLPFLPTVSAILILADLVKTNLSIISDFNYAELSLRKQTGNFIKLLQKPKPCFVCKEIKKELYTDAVTKTKYWNFLINS